MAESPPDLSLTPPGTPLSASPRYHQTQHQQPHHHHQQQPPHPQHQLNNSQTNLMEDPDTEGARTPKRQRVDSGSGARESLSIEAASAASFVPAIRKTPEPSPNRPAKVTINMKSPTSEIESDLNAQPQTETQIQTQTRHTSSQTPIDPPQSPPDATPTPITTSNAISASASASVSAAASPSSTPEESPQIEIADPEDMEQDPNSSNWRPLEEVVCESSQPEIIDLSDMTALVDSFPLIRADATAYESLVRFRQILDRGHIGETGVVLQKLQPWMAFCARNLDRLTLQAYVDHVDFWENLPAIVEKILRRRSDIPTQNGVGLLPCLRDFLLDYVQIALHIVQLETTLLRALSKDPDQPTPDSMSHRYLQCVTWIVAFNDSTPPLYTILDREYGNGFRNVLIDIRAHTLRPLNVADKLTEHCEVVLELIPKHSRLLNMLIFYLTITCSLVDYMPDILDTKDLLSPKDASADLLYNMTRSIDIHYQEWIAKKAPWVTSESSEALQEQISSAMIAFCHRSDEFLHRLSNDLSIEIPHSATAAQKATILTGVWRFGVLKKHFMEGRMELRVHGVDKMQGELIVVWRNFINPDPNGISNPFVQSLIHFIKDNKIVDYLVGVDSHPQLISRSSNIVGFLVATASYTDRETDIIWKAVTESQDGRVVSEILSAVTRTIVMHPSASPALLYFCEKVLNHPLERFDSSMIEFSSRLLEQAIPKGNSPHSPSHSDAQHALAIPLRLCVRLIRESTVVEDLSAEQRTQLQNLGSSKLADFIRAGIGEEDRMEIYERCIQDIAEMNQFTTGSIQALSALVPQWDVAEMMKLAAEFDLTRLVINEMLHTVNETSFDLADCFSQHSLVSRIDILSRLISQAPETVTPDLGSALWNQILLSPKMGPKGHKSVWDMMVKTIERSASQNSFLDRCIHEYMPQLTPKNYDEELLLFVKLSVYYEVRFKPPPAAGENQTIFIPVMDRIWDIILTAPPGTVETEATKFAIEVYLDHKIIQMAPRSAVEATHVAIVGRCVDQLKSAAATIKARSQPDSTLVANGGTEMETTESNDDGELNELMFKRSLLFLHRLLDGLQTRPQYSPPRGSPPVLPQKRLKGDPIDLKWQSFHGGSHSAIQSLRIGDHSTAAELVESLTQLTGFSKFTVIGGGARLDLYEKPGTLLKDIRALQAGLLMVRRAADAQDLGSNRQPRSLTSVAVEVMKHFDDIYPFLALSEELANETFKFLTAFPPKDWVLERIKSPTSKAKDLFPFEEPYVALYMFHTMLQCIDNEASEVSPNHEFVQHSIAVLREFLMSDDLSQSAVVGRIACSLATKAVDLLLSLISMYPIDDEKCLLFPEPQPLVKRLLSFIEAVRKSNGSSGAQYGQKLTCNSFAVLVEASLRDHQFWATVKEAVNVDELIQTLLLEQPHQASRNDVAERIKKACGSTKSLKGLPESKNDDEMPVSVSYTERSSHIDMLATIWQSLIKIIPKSLDYATQSAELFTVCLSMFLSVTRSSTCDVTLNEYVNEWSNVLFERLTVRTEEFVGRETVDHVAFGLVVLLEKCLETADLAKVELQTSGIGERIISEYLFPAFSPEPEAESEELLVPRIPVLHNATRNKLLAIVYLLSKQSDHSVASTIKQLDGLIPRDNQINGSWIVDRTKTLRAPEGYAGLTNLSNTCYLNSLMTQLFMNVEFRDFILKLRLVESGTSQRLLDQTQKVFALMQNSWLKSIDPIDFVESIRTYDNEAIDVTIQMDVDEFYNLLFDRWEAQIVDPEEKKKFRSFYGGQLVQQIKSKECPHISERLEPFSAIQCDIKGMASLEDSLQAYVEGEIMQGDNKYSCTSCGRHVDAVKRACLKDVPDNLIFHLKRFDFDMLTMLRSKINDQFKFPDLIDMAPYNVEYLSEPESSPEPDMFELVGVLVHTGTAESGHYYSYTRERPSTGQSPSWVEFNDADVSTFNPANIADQCFGGQTDAMHNIGGGPINKLWSAYMLFYQRVSSIEKSKEIYKPAKPDIPVRASVPIPLANLISLENELLIRSYCLFDPLYTSLVVHQLQLVQELSPSYPDKQISESLAVSVGLDTFEQLVARNKGHMVLENLTHELHNLLRRSAQTASRTLWWFCEHPTSIGNLVLKTANVDIEVRQQGLLLIITALMHYQKLLDHMDLTEAGRKTFQIPFERIVENIVDLFEELWPSILTVPRAWDDYFSFFCRLAEAGVNHVGVMLDHGILVKCLEVLWLDQNDKTRLRGPYLHYSRMVEKGRRFSYQNLMLLCTILLAKVDLSLDPVSGNEPRPLSSTGRYPPNVKEARMLMTTNEEGCLPLLIKIFQSENFANLLKSRSIISSYLASEPEAGLTIDIVKTLEHGLRMSPVTICIPYLDAALVFCKTSPNESSILNIIDYVSKGVESINNVAGIEHLEFFQLLCQDPNERAGLSRVWFNQAVQERLPEFAPYLLIDHDDAVRDSTFGLVQDLLLVDPSELLEEARARHSLVAHYMVVACLSCISSSFTDGNPNPPVESQQVSAIVSVIRYCLDKFYDDSEDDLKMMEQANQTLLILEQLTVDVPEDLVSECDIPSPEEWENTSPLASDDEIGLTVSP